MRITTAMLADIGHNAAQRILLKYIDNNGGELHQDAFDDIFRNEEFPETSWSGKTVLLTLNADNWSQWLSLLQEMWHCGKVKWRKSKDKIVYYLPSLAQKGTK